MFVLAFVGEYILATAITLAAQTVTEWVAHKYVLHDWALKKGAFFHFHWEHHNRCRKANNIDVDYVAMFRRGKLTLGIVKEMAAIAAITVVFAVPVYLFVWPMLGGMLAFGAWFYFFSHALCHTGWFPGMFPWHRDHHMGPDQNQNWCVTLPVADWVLKTRVKNPT